MYNEKMLEWELRKGLAGEFFGHGILAIMGKKDWVGWTSQLTGLSAEAATTFLLFVGLMDVIVAIIVLVKPLKPILLWAAFWGFWTALVRPLVAHPVFGGTSTLDFIERFANWAAPLALFYFYKSKGR